MCMTATRSETSRSQRGSGPRATLARQTRSSPTRIPVAPLDPTTPSSEALRRKRRSRPCVWRWTARPGTATTPRPPSTATFAQGSTDDLQPPPRLPQGAGSARHAHSGRPDADASDSVEARLQRGRRAAARVMARQAQRGSHLGLAQSCGAIRRRHRLRLLVERPRRRDRRRHGDAEHDRGWQSAQHGGVLGADRRRHVLERRQGLPGSDAHACHVLGVDCRAGRSRCVLRPAAHAGARHLEPGSHGTVHHHLHSRGVRAVSVTMRDDWYKDWGPLGSVMPIDAPLPARDWRAAFESGVYTPHEDSRDYIENQKHGPPGIDGTKEVGGSGVCFGHTRAEPDAVLVLDQAVANRDLDYDDAHAVRGDRFAFHRYELFRDRASRARVLDVVNRRKRRWNQNLVILGQPQNVPENIHQYHAMARAKPHTGTPMPLRPAGWVFWGEAMALKVEVGRSVAYAQKFLKTCELAAHEATGQLTFDTKTGINESGIQYQFHWTICAMGALACAHRLGQAVPDWIMRGVHAMADLEPVDYYGAPCPPAYVYTHKRRLVPCTGSLIEPPNYPGSPGIAYWWELIAALYRQGALIDLEMALLFGTHRSKTIRELREELRVEQDPQRLRDSQMLRGLLL